MSQLQDINNMSLKEAALEYARNGWNVFPCIPRNKAPLTPNGYKDATTNVLLISEWWTRWPEANIGFAPDDGYIAFDIDPRNDGRKPEGLPDTLHSVTGGGGDHYFYTIPHGENIRGLHSKGVDLKGNGKGYLLVPPSVTQDKYQWDTEGSLSDIECLPESHLAIVRQPPPSIAEAQPYYDDPTDQRPGSVFNRSATWKQVLEPHGWRIVGNNGDELFWCRPGKGSGISASTNYNNTDLLYVFSSSSNFEANKGYTKFSAYALLNHANDYTSAAQSLAGGSGTPPTSGPSLLDYVNSNKYGAGQQEGTDKEYQEPRLQGGHSSKQILPNPALVDRASAPVIYEFKPAFPEDHFVSKFIQYTHAQTDAPLEYAEAAALVLLAMGGYKTKASLAPYPGGLRTNLYVALVGPTTKSRKSTVQRIASEIIKLVMPPSLLPNRATTEALIKALSNRNGVPSVWCPDEFGVTLAEIYNRDFMKGLEEMLLTVYSGDDYEYQRVLDSILIRQPALSVLAAATPESISRAGTTALDSGLLPRFAVVYPTVMPDSKMVGVAPDLRAEKQYFVSQLNSILAWANNNEEITFDQEALDILNRYEGTLTANSSAARLPTMLYKIATLSAIGARVSTVRRDDALSAIAVIDRWAQGMANLVPQMYKHGSDQQFEQQLEYVLGMVHSSGSSGVLRVVVANSINVKKQRLDELESTLVDKGKIRVELGAGGKLWITTEA